MNRNKTATLIRLGTALLVLALGACSCRARLDQASLETGQAEASEQPAKQTGTEASAPAPGAPFLEPGKSFQGREITVHRFAGSGSGKILIVGGIHGNEPESEIFASALVQHLRGLEPGSLSKSLVVVPLLNPDGRIANTRKNARGVDPNRNFPTRDFSVGDPKHKYYGGAQAGSEPETQFLIALMEREKPELLVMLHTPYDFINSDGDTQGLGPGLAKTLGMEYHASMDYPTPGSVGTYFGKERGVPVITVEFPSRADVWARYGKKMLKFLLEAGGD